MKTSFVIIRILIFLRDNFFLKLIFCSENIDKNAGIKLYFLSDYCHMMIRIIRCLTLIFLSLVRYKNFNWNKYIGNKKKYIFIPYNLLAISLSIDWRSVSSPLNLFLISTPHCFSFSLNVLSSSMVLLDTEGNELLTSIATNTNMNAIHILESMITMDSSELSVDKCLKWK